MPVIQGPGPTPTMFITSRPKATVLERMCAGSEFLHGGEDGPEIRDGRGGEEEPAHVEERRDRGQQEERDAERREEEREQHEAPAAAAAPAPARTSRPPIRRRDCRATRRSRP